MTDEERRAWLKMLLVLLLAAGLRAGWSRATSGAGGPGRERSVAAALDTVEALAAEAERRSRPLGPEERIDPNRADAVDLDRLPGVGPATAAAIIEERERGVFTAPGDLLRVRGIGPASLARLEPHLGIAPPPGGRDPVDASLRAPGLDLNAADSTELMALPGIGPALAGRIVRYRAREGAFGEVGELERVRGIGPATAARLAPLVRIR